jgi:hypothetical protein
MTLFQSANCHAITSYYSHCQVRKWQRKLVKVGHFSAWKWIPEVVEPTAAFKTHALAKGSEQTGKKSKAKKKSLLLASSAF